MSRDFAEDIVKTITGTMVIVREWTEWNRSPRILRAEAAFICGSAFVGAHVVYGVGIILNQSSNGG